MTARRSPRSPEAALHKLVASITSGESVCCVTGAGLSADSGIPTFRNAPNSVWDQHTLRYARRDVFFKDPLKWYNKFWLKAFNWQAISAAMPNNAHKALAKIACKYPSFRLVTQNIDRLHEHPDACVPPGQYLPVHGRAGKFRCARISPAQKPCPVVDFNLNTLMTANSICNGELQIANPPKCSTCESCLMPEALLFDEEYDAEVWDCWNRWLNEACAIVFVGSSNSVGLTKHATNLAREKCIPLFNFNLSSSALSVPSSCSPVFHVLGPAAVTLPSLATRLGLM